MTITPPLSSPAPVSSAGAAPLTSAALPVWWPIAQQLSHVEPLERRRCLKLLPPAGQGWVLYPQQPHRVPTAYRVHEESLLVTAEQGVPLVPAPLVLFRIEHLDPHQRFGWTVGVAGPLEPRGPAAAIDTQTDEQPLLVLALTNLAGRLAVARSADAPVPAELEQPSAGPAQHLR